MIINGRDGGRTTLCGTPVPVDAVEYCGDAAYTNCKRCEKKDTN